MMPPHRGGRPEPAKVIAMPYAQVNGLRMKELDLTWQGLTPEEVRSIQAPALLIIAARRSG